VDAEHVVDELGLAVLGVNGPAAEPAALSDDHACGIAVGDVEFRGDGERPVLDATTLFSDRRPMPAKNIWVVPWMSVGRPAIDGSNRSELRSSMGNTLY